MMKGLKVCLLWLCAVQGIAADTKEGGGDLVIVILDNDADAAFNLSQDINLKAAQHDKGCVVHIASQVWPNTAAWAYSPVIPSLYERHGRNASWIVFVQEHVQIDYDGLVAVLNKHMFAKDDFIGYGLSDEEPTIIHHFAMPEVPLLFPDPRTGLAISVGLLRRLNKNIISGRKLAKDFTIDSSYEFAKMIRKSGSFMVHEEQFCIKQSAKCVVLMKPPRDCGPPVPSENVHFAVKTCSKFHKERLPVVQSTWLKHTNNYALYSEVEDEEFGTIDIGIPNTEHGHCAKTMFILHQALKMPNLHWLVVVDDDTLLSVERMLSTLACYPSEKGVVVGEKYGYALSSPHGYEYITGGGGIALNREAVRQVVMSGQCKCPSPDAPDDMMLGLCFRRLAIQVLHNWDFHQARPYDYAKDRLEGSNPISFHKHWMIDPIKVYNTYLSNVEADSEQGISGSKSRKTKKRKNKKSKEKPRKDGESFGNGEGDHTNHAHVEL
ncbi:beta-1,3-glucosyltransferase [Oratosquilla oratoria]|uniref:beta-1,3-glucosyltransferase n=1 Tax=Oratosquilla oratoria TaxID=337810 RepID=UPI003F75A699